MGAGERSETVTSPEPAPSPGVVLLGDAISVLRSEWASTFSDVSRLTSLRELWPQVCALSAHVTERIGDIHVAGAATADAFASTTALLRARLRMSGGEAGKFIRVAVGLRKLRAVTAAFAEGRISLEHADAICHVAADLGDAAMADGQLEQVLLEYALVKNSTDVRQLGRMIKSHIISKESAEERQVRMYEGRWLQSATTFDGMVHLEAMLDPITGAAVQAALAAYMPGPDKDRSRTPRQRRADALADIVTVALANKDRSLTGDEKPHVTVTIPLDTLLHGHPTVANTDSGTGDTADTGLTGDTVLTGDTGDGRGDGDGRPPGTDTGRGQARAGDGRGQTGERAGNQTVNKADNKTGNNAGDPGGRRRLHHHPPPGGEPVNTSTNTSASAWDLAMARQQAQHALRRQHNGNQAEITRAYLADYLKPGTIPVLGTSREPISPEAARRLACDAKIIPIVLGTRSEPLDIGRASRTVPLPMRRAIEFRDVHCRFPGCDRPAKWCEAHHVRFWVRDEGPTEINNLVLTCKFHHVVVHEYGWNLTFDPVTNTVRVTRPDGTPHDLVSTCDGAA